MKNENDLLEVAHSNFKMWNEALQTKNPKRVALLYSDDASFLPTLNGELKTGQEEAEGYFEHFLLKNPFGRILKERVQPLGDSYIHSGLYDFEVGKDGERQTVKARFTYVWQKEKDGNWRIIHHHSSVKPD